VIRRSGNICNSRILIIGPAALSGEQLDCTDCNNRFQEREQGYRPRERKFTVSSAAVKASFDSKLNTMNQSLTDLKEQMVKLNENVATQTKNQKLEWASNAGINSFKFYTKDNDYSGVESTGFVKTILLSFRNMELGIT
jgi:hypothetical protein